MDKMRVITAAPHGADEKVAIRKAQKAKKEKAAVRKATRLLLQAERKERKLREAETGRKRVRFEDDDIVMGEDLLEVNKSERDVEGDVEMEMT